MLHELLPAIVRAVSDRTADVTLPGEACLQISISASDQATLTQRQSEHQGKMTRSVRNCAAMVEACSLIRSVAVSLSKLKESTAHTFLLFAVE